MQETQTLFILLIPLILLILFVLFIVLFAFFFCSVHYHLHDSFSFHPFSLCCYFYYTIKRALPLKRKNILLNSCPFLKIYLKAYHRMGCR